MDFLKPYLLYIILALVVLVGVLFWRNNSISADLDAERIKSATYFNAATEAEKEKQAAAARHTFDMKLVTGAMAAANDRAKSLSKLLGKISKAKDAQDPAPDSYLLVLDGVSESASRN
jgi:hypothetical protein